MNKKNTVNFLGKPLFVLMGMALGFVLLPGGAMAAAIGPNLASLGSCSTGQGIGDAICNVILGSDRIPGLITGVAYLVGLIFGVAGILKLKDHVLYPDRVTIWESVKRFIAGGALFALPIVAESLYNSIVGTTTTLAAVDYTGFDGNGAQTSGAGLDTVVVALVKDLWQPLLNLLGGFGYIAAFILMLVGIMRLVKTSQEGARGPGGFGTIMTFVTAAALFSLDKLMGAFSYTMFGSETVTTSGVLQYTTGMTAAEVNHVHAVISAVIGFVAMVGWISFIRGWFILRDVAEGNQQASMMAAVTHIFGGALCVNLGPLLNAVQYTFGLLGVGVGFV